MLNQVLKPVLERLPENNRLELIWKLAQIDFSRRYYDNYLGLFWALLNPLFKVAVYYFAFTYILGHGMPNYALYLFSGLIFWMFFSEGTNRGITVLKAKKYLIENIQFNKVDLFISHTLSIFLGFSFNILAYFLIALLFGIFPTVNYIALPILMINVFFLVLAFSLLLSTLSIYLKDIVHVWTMVILLGFWVTPIFYKGDVFTGKLAILLYANPMSGIVINARHVLLDGTPIDYFLLSYNLLYSLILLIFAIFLFNRYSHKVAENL